MGKKTGTPSRNRKRSRRMRSVSILRAEGKRKIGQSSITRSPLILKKEKTKKLKKKKGGMGETKKSPGLMTVFPEEKKRKRKRDKRKQEKTDGQTSESSRGQEEKNPQYRHREETAKIAKNKSECGVGGNRGCARIAFCTTSVQAGSSLGKKVGKRKEKRVLGPQERRGQSRNGGGRKGETIGGKKTLEFKPIEARKILSGRTPTIDGGRR